MALDLVITNYKFLVALLSRIPMEFRFYLGGILGFL
jgi:hypothetical protein